MAVSSGRLGTFAMTNEGRKSGINRQRPPRAMENRPKTIALVRQKGISLGTPELNLPGSVYANPAPASGSAWSMNQNPFSYRSETLGNEFSVLTYVPSWKRYQYLFSLHALPSDFLETLDEGSFFTPHTVAPSLMSSASFPTSSLDRPRYPSEVIPPTESTSNTTTTTQTPQKPPEEPPVVLPAATKTERFLLTAADQESGSRNERLNRVIRSKYEAGLLKPYNYVKGYARLSRWMDRK